MHIEKLKAFNDQLDKLEGRFLVEEPSHVKWSTRIQLHMWCGNKYATSDRRLSVTGTVAHCREVMNRESGNYDDVDWQPLDVDHEANAVADLLIQVLPEPTLRDVIDAFVAIPDCSRVMDLDIGYVADLTDRMIKHIEGLTKDRAREASFIVTDCCGDTLLHFRRATDINFVLGHEPLERDVADAWLLELGYKQYTCGNCGDRGYGIKFMRYI